MKSKKDYWVSFIFCLPGKGELIQLALFLLLLLLSLLRVEREYRYMWFEEEGLVHVLILAPPSERDERLSATVKIVGGDFPELYQKRAFLTLYGASDVPSKAFSVWAKVKAEGQRVFVSGSYKDIQEVLTHEPTLRDRFIKRVEERVQDQELKALVLTYVFGESKEILFQDVQYYFLKTGLVHLLVISGFHVGMVFLVLRYLLPYPYGLWLGALGVSLYVFLLVPSEPPVLRAWLMLLLWVFVRLNQASPNGLGILLFSASLLLFIKPEFVHSFSFWLSFFATLYILLGMRLLPSYGSVFYRYLVLPFGVSFFAFLGVSPLLLSLTHASLGSILFSPLVGYMFLPFTLYGILQLSTFFSLPTFPLELMGHVIVLTVAILSNFNLELRVTLSKEWAFAVSSFFAILLYAFGTLKRVEK